MGEIEVLAEFKRKVKEWLKSNGRNYRWVAERCGVSEITVRNWLSQKSIPERRKQLLEAITFGNPHLAPARHRRDCGSLRQRFDERLTREKPDIMDKNGGSPLSGAMKCALDVRGVHASCSLTIDLSGRAFDMLRMRAEDSGCSIGQLVNLAIKQVLEKPLPLDSLADDELDTEP